ncbi:MAG: hypothetical protein PHR83_06435 [Paludibacter sp.]|nr:hypothetical protein [Paludibacter sp.]
MKRKSYFFKFKELTKAIFIMGGLIISANSFSQDVTTGLILHYNFDAVSGTTVPDASGNGNIGTIVGAPKDTAGYSGRGVYCGPKSDYISLPAGINSTLSSFTYATWVKMDALKNAVRFFDLGIGADATNNFLAFIPSYNGDNQVMCLRYRPASGTAYNVVSTAKCPIGAWAHVAVTYNWDGAAGTATIYLNGAVVGTGTGLPYNISTALGATSANYLGISRWGQDANGFNGVFDDVRFYNRALTGTDILTLTGLAELNTQYSALNITNTTAVISDITLPTSMGTQGITVTWKSSNSAVIDSLGHVTRPQQYDATVKLTATLTQIVGEKTYTMNKVFNVKVLGIIATPDEIAEWNFTTDNISVVDKLINVKDVQSGFTATLMNDASIRTIGTTEQFNVLDLGNGTGYLDMGTDIGKAIYSLNDYSMCSYFRVDDAATITGNGNFIWTFSNTNDALNDKSGYIIGHLNSQIQEVTPTNYQSGNQSVSVGSAAAKGAWHHFAYIQKGDVGTIYIDGVLAKSGTMTNLPSTTLPIAGRTGTLYNWLGRSNYTADAYLKNTLLYDFKLSSFALSSDDLNFALEVPATLDKLNTAYAENPKYTSPELTTEINNLTLGDLSAVTTDVTLPSKGTIDPTINIIWKSTNDSLITANGVVTRPNYYNYNDTLTATLTKNGQAITKAFPATVLAKPATAFTSDLLVKFDFSSVSDSVVTDAAEKHFKGTIKNNAKIIKIGTTDTGIYNVLSLGDSIGYFDMGTEIGKLLYNQKDFTIGAYYRVSAAYDKLASNGNFLWNFSNSKDIINNPTGYLIASLKNQAATITPTNWSSEQSANFATPALQDSWHNMTYTQSGATGTLYVDGIAVVTGAAITSLPATTLARNGKLGTLYNWIGRSCYTGDVYLRKTLVYDFRLYSKALTDAEVQTSILNVGETLGKLDAAYAAASAVNSLKDTRFNVTTNSGIINISGLNATDNVALYDIAGRRMNVANPSLIKANAGIYILKINEYNTKVVVK